MKSDLYIKKKNKYLVTNESQLLKVISSNWIQSIDTSAEAKAILLGLDSINPDIKSVTVDFLDEIYSTFHSGYTLPKEEVAKIISEALLEVIIIEKNEQLQYEMLEVLTSWVVPKIKIELIEGLFNILKSLPTGSLSCAIQIIKTSGHKKDLPKTD